MGMHLRLVKLNQLGFDHAFLAVACFVICAVAGSAMLVASHAQTAQWTGVLEAFSAKSGYCLTTKGSTKGSSVVLNACSKTYNKNQVWTLNNIHKANVLGVNNAQYFSLQSAAGSNMCLDDWSKSIKKAFPEKLYPCSSTDTAVRWTWGTKFTSQKFSTHQLANLASGSSFSKALCLDVQYGSHKPNTNVGQYACKTTGQSNQSWFEVSAPSKSGGTTGSGSGSSSGSGSGSGSSSGSGSGSGSSGSGTGSTASSNISCNYQVDTWSGDAPGVGYSATGATSKDGNPASFSVKLNANKSNTEVVGYPSEQCLMYSALPSSLSSTFKITPPASSQGLDYEYAYDIWLTSATAAKNNNWDNDLELMIWNYNNNQEPAGSVKATLADGSKVWVDGNNTTGLVSVVLPKNETSGTINIASVVSQLKSTGYVSNSLDGILDVEYGIEAPYGGGQTFAVNSLAVN